jgi:hypothetical protein
MGAGSFACSWMIEKGKVELVSEALEYAPPTRTVSRGMIKGRHPVTTRRMLSEVDGGTLARIEIEYRVPVRLPIIDRLYERRWVRAGQIALDGTLLRWKASFPGTSGVATAHSGCGNSST